MERSLIFRWIEFPKLQNAFTEVQHTDRIKKSCDKDNLHKVTLKHKDHVVKVLKVFWREHMSFHDGVLGRPRHARKGKGWHKDKQDEQYLKFFTVMVKAQD
jgi:hypothetical protein